MPRSLWTGSLSFGLVNVPVALITAVRDQDLHFTQIHEKDGAPIEVHRYCDEEGVEVPYEEITHGYDCDDGTQVIVSDLELEAIEPRRTRTIDIEQFVDLDDVDPIYFNHPYFLVPSSDDDGATRAYRLLSEVMSRTDRAALGRFVMRAKEYLAIVRARDGVLTLTTMLFADEVRSTKDVEAATQKSHKPTPKQVNAAVAVIEELTTDWDPSRYEDEYRKRLKAVVNRKRKGETIKSPTAAKAPSPAPDLMDALERTLAEMTGDGGESKSKSKSKGKRSEGGKRKRTSKQKQEA
jgi:DNA end-binding protein Ku